MTQSNWFHNFRVRRKEDVFGDADSALTFENELPLGMSHWNGDISDSKNHYVYEDYVNIIAPIDNEMILYIFWDSISDTDIDHNDILTLDKMDDIISPNFETAYQTPEKDINDNDMSLLEYFNNSDRDRSPKITYIPSKVSCSQNSLTENFSLEKNRVGFNTRPPMFFRGSLRARIANGYRRIRYAHINK